MSVFPQQSEKVAFRKRVKEEVSCEAFAVGESAQALWDQHYSAPRASFREPLRMLGVPRLGSPRPALTPAFRPARPCTRSPCATGELTVGPETRSRPAARSSEPHFLLAGRGRRRAFPVVHWQQQRRHHSQLLRVAAPGQSSAAGRAGARRRGRAPRLPLHPWVWDLLSRSRPLDALPSTVALYCRGHFPPERGKHLQGPQEPLSRLSPDLVSLPGLSNGNLLWSTKSGNHLSCLLSPIPPTPVQSHFLSPIWIP